MNSIKQPLLDSNQRIQGSKPCALPLGEEAIHPTAGGEFVFVPVSVSKMPWIGLTLLSPISVVIGRLIALYCPALWRHVVFNLSIRIPTNKWGAVHVRPSSTDRLLSFELCNHYDYLSSFDHFLCGVISYSQANLYSSGCFVSEISGLTPFNNRARPYPMSHLQFVNLIYVSGHYIFSST